MPYDLANRHKYTCTDNFLDSKPHNYIRRKQHSSTTFYSERHGSVLEHANSLVANTSSNDCKQYQLPCPSLESADTMSNASDAWYVFPIEPSANTEPSYQYFESGNSATEFSDASTDNSNTRTGADDYIPLNDHSSVCSNHSNTCTDQSNVCTDRSLACSDHSITCIDQPNASTDSVLACFNHSNSYPDQPSI